MKLLSGGSSRWQIGQHSIVTLPWKILCRGRRWERQDPGFAEASSGSMGRDEPSRKAILGYHPQKHRQMRKRVCHLRGIFKRWGSVEQPWSTGIKVVHHRASYCVACLLYIQTYKRGQQKPPYSNLFGNDKKNYLQFKSKTSAKAIQNTCKKYWNYLNFESVVVWKLFTSITLTVLSTQAKLNWLTTFRKNRTEFNASQSWQPTIIFTIHIR